jgi:hypothetical protein
VSRRERNRWIVFGLVLAVAYVAYWWRNWPQPTPPHVLDLRSWEPGVWLVPPPDAP